MPAGRLSPHDCRLCRQWLGGRDCGRIRGSRELSPQSFPQRHSGAPLRGVPSAGCADIRPGSVRVLGYEWCQDACGTPGVPSNGRSRSPPESPAGGFAPPARQHPAAAEAARRGRPACPRGRSRSVVPHASPARLPVPARAARGAPPPRSTAIMPVSGISGPNSGMRSSSLLQHITAARHQGEPDDRVERRLMPRRDQIAAPLAQRAPGRLHRSTNAADHAQPATS